MSVKYLYTSFFLLVFSTRAFGGFALEVPVSIVDIDAGPSAGLTRAQGGMYSARASDNPTELIGCDQRAFTAEDAARFGLEEGIIVGSCQAVDSAGRNVSCETFDPLLLQVISSANPYSYINFFVLVDQVDEGREFGQCARISVSSRSFYLPLTAQDKDTANKK